MTATLAEIVEALGEHDLLLKAPESLPDIAALSVDSRAVRPGTLFVAIRGTTVDGHDFVDRAIKVGAPAVVVERGIADVPQIVVRDSRKAAAVAAAVWYGSPGAHLRLIGVTGTNGKSTSVTLLRHVRSSVEPTASMGTIGAFLADGERLESEAGTLTTPSPLGVHATLRSLADYGIHAVAMEVSSHALEQHRVFGLEYDICLFTALSREHLDYHGDMDAYRAAKLKLRYQLSRRGMTVVNRDDPAWDDVTGPDVIGFGIDQPAQLSARSIESHETGSSFDIEWEGARASVSLPLAGRYNVSNALGVAACALALEQPLDDVASRLSTVPQVPGRMERLCVAPCLVLRDYAHTPDALARVLSTLREWTRGRILLVYGAGGDRDRGNRAPMGKVAAEGADVTFLTTDNPRSEDPRDIARDVEEGMGAAARRWVADREEAIAVAIEEASPDDTVLLAGKGHETYQIVGAERLPFDERGIVERLTKGAK